MYPIRIARSTNILTRSAGLLKQAELSRSRRWGGSNSLSQIGYGLRYQRHLSTARRTVLGPIWGHIECLHRKERSNLYLETKLLWRSCKQQTSIHPTTRRRRVSPPFPSRNPMRPGEIYGNTLMVGRGGVLGLFHVFLGAKLECRAGGKPSTRFPPGKTRRAGDATYHLKMITEYSTRNINSKVKRLQRATS